MSRFFLLAGAGLAALAVAAGAFGAHGLEGRVSPERIETFKTGVTYQMYHALALLFVGWWTVQAPSPAATWAGACFLAGILLFSGSLYVLVLTDTPWLGAVTPFGGVAFLVGWALVIWSVWQSGG
jgi:uncharacterized membrane protein YgdD (TMEM256/DUF423 family)